MAQFRGGWLGHFLKVAPPRNNILLAAGKKEKEPRKVHQREKVGGPPMVGLSSQKAVFKWGFIKIPFCKMTKLKQQLCTKTIRAVSVYKKYIQFLKGSWSVSRCNFNSTCPWHKSLMLAQLNFLEVFGKPVPVNLNFSVIELEVFPMLPTTHLLKDRFWSPIKRSFIISAEVLWGRSSSGSGSW